ncbi:MAG: apolipoprotein N-acyltransferase [Burkholderiaceae bacterium]|nr:apolipoprotein N-acyltransferase [Burkholderiaceae bacterium]
MASGLLAAGMCAGLSLSLAYVCTIVPVLACALALHLIHAGKKVRNEIFRFAMFAAGFTLGGAHWIGLAIYRPPANGLMDTALLCTVLLGLVALVHIALFTAVRLAVAGVSARPGPVLLAFCVALAWSLAELLCSVGSLSFPWGALGCGQIDNPILSGLYPIIGSVGVSGATWLLAAFFAGVYRSLPRPGAQVGWGIALVVAAWATRFVSWTAPIDTPLTVRVVHTDWPEEIKYAPKNQLASLALLRSQAQSGGADLVVFPELFLTQRPGRLPISYRQDVVQAVKQSGTAVLFGVPGLALLSGDETPVNQNTLVLIDKAGRTSIYAKEILLPFSEYFPETAMLRWAYPFLYRYPLANLQAGATQQEVMRVKGIALGITICSELAYPGKAATQAANAAILVNASSDSWVNSRFYLLQAQTIARVRAAEAQKPLIRANNVGPSAFISADGTVVSDLHGMFGHSDLQVRGRTGRTPFVRVASMLFRS